MVIVDAEPGVRAEAVYAGVAVTGGTAQPDALRYQETIGSAAEPVRFPFRVAIVPLDGDVRRVFGVEVEALTAGRVRVGVVRAVSGFVEGRTLELRLVLEDCCRGMDCDGQTCRGCACVDPIVPPGTLPDLGTDAGAADAGRPDAADVRDAGTDAPVAPDGGAGCEARADGSSCRGGDGVCCGGECVDTSADARHCGGCNARCDPTTMRCSGGRCVECVEHADCDDGVDCTDDLCLSGGTCRNTPMDARCPPGDTCEGPATCTLTGCAFLGATNGIPCGSGGICACLGCMDPTVLCMPCDATSSCERDACSFAGYCAM